MARWVCDVWLVEDSASFGPQDLMALIAFDDQTILINGFTAGTE